MNIPPGSSFHSIENQYASSSAGTTTLGPFVVSTSVSGGLWLLYIDISFGVPTAAINEDVQLLDINSAVIFQWHQNLGIAPMPPQIIRLIFPYPGIRLGAVSASKMQYTISTPATVSGPTVSVNMTGYVV